MLNKIMRKDRLFYRVAIGFAIGVFLGLVLPQFAKDTRVVGDMYLIMIKMMIIPILICAVAGGIVNIKEVGSLRRMSVKMVLSCIVMYIFSSIIAFVVAFTINPGKGIVFDNVPVWDGKIVDTSFIGFLLSIFPSNIFQSMAKGDILPVIMFTMLISIAVIAVGKAGEPVRNFINSASAVIFKVLDYVMETSPIGVMSLMAFSVAQYGMGIFTALGKYILACWTSCAVVFLVVMFLPVIMFTGIKARHFLRGIYKIVLMTLATTSSAATLPTTLRVNIDEFGVPEEISGFVLPLGCTINMAGGACHLCCLSVFVSEFYGLKLDLSTMAGMVVVATIINMSSPGIPGGGIVLGASFLSIFGLPFDLMGPISAFYRLLDMAFTSANVLGDVVINLFIGKSEKKWNASMVTYDK